MTRGDSSCRASWRSKAATTSGSKGEYPLLACRKYKSFGGSMDKIMSLYLGSPLVLNVHSVSSYEKLIVVARLQCQKTQIKLFSVA